MTVLELVRLQTGKQGTFGVLKVNKEIFCATLEPPDRGNEPFKSSVPTGQYEVEAYGQTYKIMDVPGRTRILFHPGNKVTDTKGCILVGETFEKLQGDRAILNSGRTFGRFREALRDDKASLTIREVY